MPFFEAEIPEDHISSGRHFWGYDKYRSILDYFLLINYKNELIENEVVDILAKLYIGVMIAGMKYEMLLKGISIDDIFKDVVKYKG